MEQCLSRIGISMELSIITINKNNAAGLEETLASVACQTFQDYEYIVIDGASNDGSVERIKKYADKITYWASEPDTGIYNAMNKGIRKARGEFCLFLNSGDWLIDRETLQNVFGEIAGLPPAGVYYSDGMKSNNTLDKVPESITVNTVIFGRGCQHQNAIIKRSLFLEHGLYNENLKVTADREFWLKEVYLHKTIFHYIKTK